MFRRFLIRFLLFVCAVAGAWYYVTSRPIRHQPGVLVANPPVQKAMAAKPLEAVKGWQLTAVAEYRLRGRVLGKKRYHSGPQSTLVPIDVAVGWRRMSDQAVLDQLKVSMTNRFFFYEWQDEPPIPQDEIKMSAANNHVISANAEVRKVIGSLRLGQIVTLEGYLVNAIGPDGGTWNSSLTRDDTGNGACEVFYVEKAEAVNFPGDEM